MPKEGIKLRKNELPFQSNQQSLLWAGKSTYKSFWKAKKKSTIILTFKIANSNRCSCLPGVHETLHHLQQGMLLLERVFSSRGELDSAYSQKVLMDSQPSHKALIRTTSWEVSFGWRANWDKNVGRMFFWEYSILQCFKVSSTSGQKTWVLQWSMGKQRGASLVLLDCLQCSSIPAVLPNHTQHSAQPGCPCWAASSRSWYLPSAAGRPRCRASGCAAVTLKHLPLALPILSDREAFIYCCNSNTAFC